MSRLKIMLNAKPDGRMALALLLIALLSFASFVSPAAAQDQPPKPDEKKENEQRGKEKKKDDKSAKDKPELPEQGKITFTPAEIIAEYTILAFGGRKALESARSAIQEEGTIRLASDQGDLTGSYVLRSQRGEKSWLDLLRVDLEINTPEAAVRQGAEPTVKYSIAFNGASVWSAQNNQYVTPTPAAEAAFKGQLVHDYTALLRYREDGSKLEQLPGETVVGVEAHVLDLIRPDGVKTRFWVSKKTFRILHLEYELTLEPGKPPTRYRVSYYYTPVRVVQNTLVPGRRVMAQDGKFVQEVNLTDFKYSAKFEPEIFQHLQGE